MARPALQLVDPDTGEITACPHCIEWERTYAELERKYRGALAQIGNLRADKDAEARQHELWPAAVGLFEFWKKATRHPKARWTADRFWTVQRFLAAENGPNECRWALRGLLGSDYHMKRGEYEKRKGPRYDEFERPFKDQPTFEKWRDAGMPSQETRDFFEWYEALPG